jgi:hypothetical protein
MHDPEIQAMIKSADVIFGEDPATGVENGLYYGVAALRRIKRRQEPEQLRVVHVPIDPATDDVEALIVLVQGIKGACCYDALTKKD